MIEGREEIRGEIERVLALFVTTLVYFCNCRLFYICIYFCNCRLYTFVIVTTLLYAYM